MVKKVKASESVLTRFAMHAMSSLHPELQGVLKKPKVLSDSLAEHSLVFYFNDNVSASKFNRLIAHFRDHLPFEDHTLSERGEPGIFVGGFVSSGLVLRHFVEKKK